MHDIAAIFTQKQVSKNQRMVTGISSDIDLEY